MSKFILFAADVVDEIQTKGNLSIIVSVCPEDAFRSSLTRCIQIWGSEDINDIYLALMADDTQSGPRVDIFRDIAAIILSSLTSDGLIVPFLADPSICFAEAVLKCREALQRRVIFDLLAASGIHRKIPLDTAMRVLQELWIIEPVMAS